MSHVASHDVSHMQIKRLIRRPRDCREYVVYYVFAAVAATYYTTYYIMSPRLPRICRILCLRSSRGDILYDKFYAETIHCLFLFNHQQKIYGYIIIIIILMVIVRIQKHPNIFQCEKNRANKSAKSCDLPPRICAKNFRCTLVKLV